MLSDSIFCIKSMLSGSIFCIKTMLSGSIFAKDKSKPCLPSPGALMKNVNLEGSLMAGVNLRVANLKNANLQNCDLRGAVLAGADLEVRCNSQFEVEHLKLLVYNIL